MKIIKIMNAAIGATQERTYITKNARKQLDDRVEQIYYNKITQETGPSTHKPVQIAKSWYKAYKLNMERQNLVEELNKPFKTKGAIVSIIEKMFKRG